LIIETSGSRTVVAILSPRCLVRNAWGDSEHLPLVADHLKRLPDSTAAIRQPRSRAAPSTAKSPTRSSHRFRWRARFFCEARV